MEERKGKKRDKRLTHGGLRDRGIQGSAEEWADSDLYITTNQPWPHQRFLSSSIDPLVLHTILLIRIYTSHPVSFFPSLATSPSPDAFRLLVFPDLIFTPDAAVISTDRINGYHNRTVLACFTVCTLVSISVSCFALVLCLRFTPIIIEDATAVLEHGKAKTRVYFDACRAQRARVLRRVETRIDIRLAFAIDLYAVDAAARGMPHADAGASARVYYDLSYLLAAAARVVGYAGYLIVSFSSVLLKDVHAHARIILCKSVGTWLLPIAATPPPTRTLTYRPRPTKGHELPMQTRHVILNEQRQPFVTASPEHTILLLPPPNINTASPSKSTSLPERHVSFHEPSSAVQRTASNPTPISPTHSTTPQSSDETLTPSLLSTSHQQQQHSPAPSPPPSADAAEHRRRVSLRLTRPWRKRPSSAGRAEEGVMGVSELGERVEDQRPHQPATFTGHEAKEEMVENGYEAEMTPQEETGMGHLMAANYT
ncbi:hypothetical protein EW146_g873 [Bondarzewia mesenterica]|uniref:Uncharacterized protein n=1 Tax=Bondarzewia mesenterica TaxID=1095465 RepID=A0A4S4M5L4_9AGAM|nr:hypothetical protein EW146_g873 [Bondarzewia mesenterica]